MKLDSHQFGTTYFQSTLRAHLQFELKSLYGRLFRKVPERLESYLQLGCGPNLISGFTNVDFYSIRLKKKKLHVGHDFRFPLPFPNNQFHGAYSEHTLEHLYPNQAMSLLGEIYRVLRKGSIFRCTVPDLGKYIDFYMGKKLPGFDRFESGCEAIWSLTQNWGHLSVWDAHMLAKHLSTAGFHSIDVCQYRQGKNPELLVDQETRAWETLYIEAEK